MGTVSSASTRTTVFISYSHRDAKYLDGLLPHLQYLEKNQQIDLWIDNKIKPGDTWRDEIASALASAKVAILLISIDFLNSQFIADNELPPLLAAAECEGVKILPVILRPCTLPHSLSQFQAVNSPSRPLSKMSKSQREEIWVKVANTLLEAMTPDMSEEEVRSNDHQRESKKPSPPAITHEHLISLFDLREATHTRNWTQAEQILQKYPDLPQAHSLLGLSMSRAVQEHFSNQLHPNYSLSAYNLGGPITPMSQIRYPLLLSPVLPKAEAIHWLEKALEYGYNPEGNVTAGLAFMYGYNDNYLIMVDAIKQTLAINPSLISDFQLPDNLMMLLYACHTLASVAEVMDNVGLKIPELEDVQQTLRDGSDPKNNPSVSAYPCLDWYAVDLSMGKSVEMPVKVVVPFPNKGLTYAQVLKQGQAPITIPPQPTSYHIETIISVEEILMQLAEIGIFLITPIQTYSS